MNDQVRVVLLVLIFSVAAANLILSIAKLAMMSELRKTLYQFQHTTEQYITLTQQYHDLYAREGRDTQQVVVNAATAILDTVKGGGPLSDSGGHPIITEEQRLKALERLARHDVAPPGETR